MLMVNKLYTHILLVVVLNGSSFLKNNIITDINPQGPE